MEEFKIPTDICDEAIEEMTSIIEKLNEEGALSSLDFPALRSFARTIHVYTMTWKEVSALTTTTAKTKFGEPRPHPALKMLELYDRQLRQYYNEFGLTRASRKEINKSRVIEEDTAIDTFIKQVRESR